jgi:hypothetical protein
MSVSSNLPVTSPRPIAAAATATTYFEQARIFNRCANISLGEALSRDGASRAFEKVDVTATVKNYRLENVLLNADTLLLFQAGHAIPETAYFKPTFLPDDEDFVLGYNNAHRGYQHWLTQCVPAIDWSLRQSRTRVVRLLLPPLEPWQEDFLSILGYSEASRVTLQPGAYYHLPQVEYSDFLNGTASFGISLSLLDTAKRILQRLPAGESSEKVLYVPALNPYYGSIRNENEVMDLLRSRGVYIVERNLRTADRINLFRQADVVIGPLGQGLTDILFCKPGALLWEWMPRQHQNASFNRLAQAAQVDYWGDMFENVTDPETPGQWKVDIAAVTVRLSELSTRLAKRFGEKDDVAEEECYKCSSVPKRDLVSQPLNELLLKFESLGDNCEFGLVQRLGGAEPLGLLRFAGFFLPVEVRLQKLVAALERKFEGLGDIDTINAYLAGEPGRREFMVRESAYALMYHTFILEGTVAPEVLRNAEVKRLGFLRRKLLEDLAAGDKIWVWRSHVTLHVDQVRPLLEVLRRLGPNTLLWIVEADDEHAAGMIEPLSQDFIKGYVRRFAPYENATDIHLASWLEVCWRAYEFRHHDQGRSDPERSGMPEGLSAIERLTHDRGSVVDIAALPTPESSTFSRLWRWLRLRA